jgi:NhaA family Na+:H+ antiporter
MARKKYSIQQIVFPIQRFIQHEKSGGIVLAISVIIAMILANSPLEHFYHDFFESIFIGIHVNGQTYFNYNIHHWINDGLMSIFFFVVGLELKREMVAGELSNIKKAMLPIGAALGGMLVPAIIYFLLNPTGEAQNGWGIPMATDIAFALGVLFILGNRIPLTLKIFLTALAIVDDLGAVLVIALFYTDQISILNLSIGLSFVLMMFIGNRMGVRNVFFYATLGIIGVWTSFLLSGVHATIAAVLAAFTIPIEVKIKEDPFINKIQNLLENFKKMDPNDQIPTITNEQLHILEKIKITTDDAIPPLQKLEHSMHQLVTFVIIPIFAIANAGVSLHLDTEMLLESNVMLGVFLGLLLGKVIGVVGFTYVLVKLKIARFYEGMHFRNVLGLGFLASIGFTMSLFVTQLAFKNPDFIMQAKIGIFAASIIGGVVGYFILSKK